MQGLQDQWAIVLTSSSHLGNWKHAYSMPLLAQLSGLILSLLGMIK